MNKRILGIAAQVLVLGLGGLFTIACSPSNKNQGTSQELFSEDTDYSMAASEAVCNAGEPGYPQPKNPHPDAPCREYDPKCQLPGSLGDKTGRTFEGGAVEYNCGNRGGLLSKPVFVKQGRVVAYSNAQSIAGLRCNIKGNSPDRTKVQKFRNDISSDCVMFNKKGADFTKEACAALLGIDGFESYDFKDCKVVPVDRKSGQVTTDTTIPDAVYEYCVRFPNNSPDATSYTKKCSPAADYVSTGGFDDFKKAVFFIAAAEVKKSCAPPAAPALKRHMGYHKTSALYVAGDREADKEVTCGQVQ